MKATKPWWSEAAGFFGQWYLDIVADILTPEQTKKDVDFFLLVGNIQKSSKVLDIGCADGRHGIELAKRGFHATCFDISSFMLKRAKANALSQNVTIQTRKGDMRTLHVSEPYDLILNVFTAFGYFEDKDHLKTLHHMFNGLKKDGICILDVAHGPFVRSHLKNEQEFRHPDGSITRYIRSLDETGKHLIETRSRIKNGVVIQMLKMKTRLWDKDELIGMAISAGFSIQSIFGDLDSHAPWSVNAKHLVLVLKK